VSAHTEGEQEQVKAKGPHVCCGSIVQLVVAILPHLHPWTWQLAAIERGSFEDCVVERRRLVTSVAI